MPRWLATGNARLVLIIDSTAVSNVQLLIEDKYFCHVLGAEEVSNFILGVLHHLKIDPILRSECIDFLLRILGVAVDADESDEVQIHYSMR